MHVWRTCWRLAKSQQAHWKHGILLLDYGIIEVWIQNFWKCLLTRKSKDNFIWENEIPSESMALGSDWSTQDVYRRFCKIWVNTFGLIKAVSDTIYLCLNRDETTFVIAKWWETDLFLNVALLNIKGLSW